MSSSAVSHRRWLGVGALAIALLACGADDGARPAGSSSGGATAGTGGSAGEGAGATGVGATGGGGGHGAEGAAGPGAGGNGGSSPTERRVFVTSKTYTGALGGISGADGACEALAGAASLGGTWKAWVGDGTDSPSTTFAQSALPYVLVGGATIASDWTDLTDGTLAVAIDHDETGTAIDPDGNTHVWTGASTTGSALPYHCEGWTSDVPGFTPRGLATATDSAWVMAGPDPCATPNHLYCFEQ